MSQNGQHLDKYNFIYVSLSLLDAQSDVITLQAPVGFDKTATSKLYIPLLTISLLPLKVTSSLELYVAPLRICCIAMPSLIVESSL